MEQISNFWRKLFGLRFVFRKISFIKWSKIRIFGENWFGLGFVFKGISLYFEVFRNYISTGKKPRQENQKTESRKRKGKEIEKEREKRKQGNAISSQILRNQYMSRKSQISQGSSRVGVFYKNPFLPWNPPPNARVNKIGHIHYIQMQ